MTWLAWRQQRLETVIACIVVVLTAAIFIPTGIGLADRYDDAELAACAAAATDRSAGCTRAVAQLVESAEGVSGLMGWFALVPLLIAILFAAPLVQELERGTYRLAWTQSMTRRRWVAVKFAVIFASATVTSALLAGIWTWWRIPLNALKGRIEPTSFQVLGLAPIAYTLMATALVIFIGVLVRRTIPTIGLSIVAFLAIRIPVESSVRPHYRPAVSDRTGSVPDSAWVIDKVAHGGNTIVTTFQPDDRFWTFQLIEAGSFLACAALLVWIAATRILRRVS